LRNRRHTIVAPLLLLVFWTGQIGLAAHAPEMAHRVCEHGELVDGPEATGSSGAVTVPGSGEAELTAAPDHGAAPREHEHCAFSTLLQLPGSVASFALPALAEPPQQPLDVPALAPRAPAAATLSLYRLAPKTSPPA
jgi:hypothetical protein